MTPNSKKKVAIVAVHGVGQHAAGASANAIAGMLLSLNHYVQPGEAGGYAEFRTSDIAIPLPRASLFRTLSSPSEAPTLWRGIRTIFEERRGFFENKYRFRSWFLSDKKDIIDQLGQADIASKFMETQLKDYRRDDKGDTERTSYSTCLIEGHRCATEGHPEIDVHIYEMHWSDLARPKNSFLSFFLAFYQLLLHITSLGRMAVDQAALEHVGEWDWFLFQRAYSYSSRLLTLFVFILLVLLPVIAFSPLPLLLAEGAAAKATAVALLFAATLGSILWRSQRGQPWFGVRHWWTYVLTIPALVALLSALLFYKHSEYIPLVLSFEWWLGAILVLFLVFFPKYDEVRNGAIQAGWILTIAVVVGFVWCLHDSGLTLSKSSFSSNVQFLRTAAFQMIQWIFLALRAGWILVIGFALVAAFAEAICRLRLRKSKDGALARARAAGRTGRFTLALPAMLLLLVTIFLWCGVYQYTVSHLHFHLFGGVRADVVYPDMLLSPYTADPSSPACQQLVSNSSGADGSSWQSIACAIKAEATHAKDDVADGFLKGLLFQSAPPGLPVVFAIIAVGFLLLVLMVLPSVYYEINPPVSAGNGPAGLLGAWLSGGLRSLRWMISCFWLGAFFVPVAYMVLQRILWYQRGKPVRFLEYLYSGPLMSVTNNMLGWSGAILAGSAALIVAFLLKYLSATLDIILDVDNYLRTTPPEDTPRARITERYLALLNFLHSFGGQGVRGYDRIVIIAHSLGSLISADLLRYLTRCENPSLTKYAFGASEPLPFFFFSMGNPLRQLLNRFFPILYGWVRPYPDGAGEAPKFTPGREGGGDDVQKADDIPEQAPPDAAELGVKAWINLYRSGDYVGRSVWLDNWCVRNAEGAFAGRRHYMCRPQVFRKVPPNCVELCIGLGAHTHYWDRTAVDVAELLDELVVG